METFMNMMKGLKENNGKLGNLEFKESEDIGHKGIECLQPMANAIQKLIKEE